MVGRRAGQTLFVGGVGDERDRAVIAAERRPGQAESPGGVGERLPNSLAPAFGVAAVVDLVENHQRPAVLGAHAVAHRVAGHLGVGDHDSVIVLRGGGVGIGESWIQGDPRHRTCRRPLGFEVFGGHHDGDPFDRAVGQKFAGDPQCECRLACSGRCHQEKILWFGRQIAHQGPPLPAPQRPGAGRLDCPHPQASLPIGSDSNATRSGWTAMPTRVERSVHRG